LSADVSKNYSLKNLLFEELMENSFFTIKLHPYLMLTEMIKKDIIMGV